MKKITITLFILTLFSCTLFKTSEKGQEKEEWKNTSCQPLVKALLKNDTVKMNKILRKGKVDINCRENRHGRTILFLALSEYKLYIIPYLLAKGADPNIKDFQGETPLAYFLSSQAGIFFPWEIEMIKSLLKYGADPNGKIIRTKKRNAALIKEILTPLLLAIEKDIALTVTLVEGGADINLETFPGYTPLYKALEYKNLYIIKYLLIDKHADYTKVYQTQNSSPKDTLFFMDLFKKYILSDKKANKKDIHDILEYIGKDSL